MDAQAFLKIYLPALEQALANDYHNVGYHVHGPDYYMTDDERHAADTFEDTPADLSPFIHTVALYFDAVSHYATTFGDEPIDLYKRKLIDQVVELKKVWDV